MTTSYKFKTKPHKHQVKALKVLVRNKGGAVFAPMRWGKTKIAIDFAGIARSKWGTKRVLIVCPHGVMGVWRREIKKHLPDESDVEFKIVNFEMVYDRYEDPSQPGNSRAWVPGPNDALYAYEPELIIVDESHRIGNPMTEQSKALFALVTQCEPLVVIMTGTPLHRKPLFLFGQFRLVDDGILGTDWQAYRKKIAVWGGYGGHVLIEYRRMKWLRKRIAPYTYYTKRVPLRKPVEEVIPYELVGKQRRAYEQMAIESVARIGDRWAEAPIVLTRLLRLAQIAADHVTDEFGDVVETGRCERTAVAEALRACKDGGLSKLVVGCRFIPELRMVAAEARHAGYEPILFHGGLNDREKEKRPFDFHEADEGTVFVSQINAGREGIDLSCADAMLFTTPPEGLLAFDQFKARIERFRDRRTLAYYYLCAELGSGNGPSVNEITLLALKQNRDLVDFIMDHPDLIRDVMKA